MVFQRNYNISREDILNEYSWSDIQNYVNTLPIEKIITVYPGKKADNGTRHLEALCDRDQGTALEQLERAEKEFLESMDLDKHEGKE